MICVTDCSHCYKHASISVVIFQIASLSLPNINVSVWTMFISHTFSKDDHVKMLYYMSPRDTSDERASLAASRVPQQVQTVLSDARVCQRSLSGIYIRSTGSNISTASHSTLRSASSGAYDVPADKDRIRRESFLRRHAEDVEWATSSS